MSTLNQAFIKAYQRRGVAAPHIPPPTTAADNGPAPAASNGASWTFDRAANGIPPAHVHPKAAATAAAAARHDRYPARDADGHNLPELPREAQAERRPEMGQATADRHHDRDEHAAHEPTADLRPAFEVERFEWPSILAALLDHSDAEFGALVGELLPTGRGAVLVTGCRRGEGRTSVALLLARRLARAGSRVLLVDADFQRPGVAASLSTEAEVGWEESLSAASPSEALIESLADALVILPLRRAVAEAAIPAAGAGLKTALDRLQAEFDVVCIDAGPLVEADGNSHELWFGGPPVEAAVVVRDVRHCRLEQSHAVGRKLVQLGARRWAIIENFV